MNDYQTQTPVLLIFFNRPDHLIKTFDRVRRARPKKLYLAQDGARPGHPEDVEGIRACREIVSHVDWECEVFERYCDQNHGCGQGPYQAISWVFDQEETAIILEDDCVADISFFPFCDQLLEKYKEDTRIGMITGLNHFTTWECGDQSYFFAKTGANWGWASWKRVWQTYDYSFEAAGCEPLLHKLEDTFINKRIAKDTIRCWKRSKRMLEQNQKISYWDYQFEANKYLYHWMAIVPQKNLISNIGVGNDSTHNLVKAPYNNLPTFEMGEIKHPKYIIQDIGYDKKYYKRACPPFPVKVINKLKSMV